MLAGAAFAAPTAEGSARRTEDGLPRRLRLLAMTSPHSVRHCEERSDAALHLMLAVAAFAAPTAEGSARRTEDGLPRRFRLLAITRPHSVRHCEERSDA